MYMLVFVKCNEQVIVFNININIIIIQGKTKYWEKFHEHITCSQKSVYFSWIHLYNFFKS